MKKAIFALLTVAIVLTACEHLAVAPKQAPSSSAALSGKVYEAETNKPVEGAYVYVYKETNTHFFGPPNHLSPPSGNEGFYSMNLPPGKYYIFARKRQSGSFQGPLQKEDFFGEVQPELISIPAGKVIINLSIQKIEGQQFYRPEKFGVKTGTLVTGRILDQSGKPVMGAFAFCYKNTFRKREPPDYGSISTDSSGRYYLYLDKGGDFIIGARMILKEPPEKGEPLGFHLNDREKTVKVATGGTLENIDIVLSPFAGTPEVKPRFIPLQR